MGKSSGKIHRSGDMTGSSTTIRASMRTPIRKNADRRPSDEILSQHQNTTAKIVLLTEKDQSIVWKKFPAPFHCLAAQNLDTGAQRILCTGVSLCSCTASFTFGLALAPEHQKRTFLRTDELRMAQTLQDIRHSTSTPKPRVLGSSPSPPGCEKLWKP